jgi:hypothetical protein
MLLSGTALIGSYTIAFTIHGEPRQWNLMVKTQGGAASECTTAEAAPYSLLDEMLASAFDASKLERKRAQR